MHMNLCVCSPTSVSLSIWTCLTSPGVESILGRILDASSQRETCSLMVNGFISIIGGANLIKFVEAPR